MLYKIVFYIVFIYFILTIGVTEKKTVIGVWQAKKWASTAISIKHAFLIIHGFSH